MEFLKKNFVILLAFTLPIMLIAVVALISYLPSTLLSTDYNFVYISCVDGTSYNYLFNCDNYLQKHYSIIGNKLVVNNVEPTLDLDNEKTSDINENYNARFFLHDTAKNESREIALEEVQTLTLNSLMTSPDGVTVSRHYGRNGSDFFFLFGGGSSSDGYYLTKGKSRNKLNLISNTDQLYYQNIFQFVGWVLPGRN